jgi:O-antigen biosynthesis protein
MTQYPTVSVIIVNYNGKHLMDDCLSSLLSVSYPKSKLEVIVVDNNSHDGSQSYIKENFPEVKLIISKDNSGFTGGNNLGFKHSKGEYIILLNSDTKVEKNWLMPLVDTAKKNPKVGLINSKLMFHIPYVEILIKSQITRKSMLDSSSIHTPLGVLAEDVIAEKNQQGEVWYAEGFYKTNKKGVKNIRWTKGEGRILLPVTPNKKNLFKFTLHGLPTKNNLSTTIKIISNGKEIISDKLNSNQVEQYEVSLKPSEENLIWLVQNAGNLILKNGYSKDIGSITRNNDDGVSEFYETNSSVFKKQHEILAVCGASCLIKRKVINEIGFLDGNYFMYYEDVDFSLRAWKMGWDILFEPKSVVYHKHRATTGKTISGFFLNMTERNHLAFLLTHFPISTYLSELMQFIKRTILTLLRYFYYNFKSDLDKRRKWEEFSSGRLKALKDTLKSFPNSFKNRIFWKKREKRTFKQMRKFMY